MFRFVNPWSRHLRTSVELLQRTFTTAQVVGDLKYAAYSCDRLAAQYDSASPEEKVRHREALAASHQQIAPLAEDCPENFESCAALVSAEIARIESRELDAERLYEKAIQSAREHGFVQNEAIAHETAARFYSDRGLETIAQAYLRNAQFLRSQFGVQFLLHEGGPILFGQFLAAEAVDELFLTLSPQIDGRPARTNRPRIVQGVEFAPNSAPWYQLLSVRQRADHLYLRYRCKRGG